MKTAEAHHPYLPGLNGLRALAAGTVVVRHINDVLAQVSLPHYGPTQGHKFAVTVFFALSGFLITYLLLREKAKTGKVSITKFYIRRILRIWPLYFIAFGGALLFNWLGNLPFDSSLLVFYILFAGNFLASIDTVIPNAAHLWSLGVEEQFYIIWPWMIRLSRRPIYTLLAFLMLFLTAKAILLFWLGPRSAYYMFFHLTRFDCMAIGGIGAWLFWSGIPKLLARVLFAIPVQVICWAALIATLFLPGHPYDVLDHTAIGVVTLVIILNLVANPQPLLRLENRFWSYLGGISFGLYIWHPLVQAANKLILPSLPISDLGKIIFLYVSVIAETILIAHLSMKYLERPFLRLKDRLGAIGK
jgi:peptidoglycan/LPS O-acetylase OafA/YrhL